MTTLFFFVFCTPSNPAPILTENPAPPPAQSESPPPQPAPAPAPIEKPKESTPTSQPTENIVPEVKRNEPKLEQNSNTKSIPTELKGEKVKKRVKTTRGKKKKKKTK